MGGVGSISAAGAAELTRLLLGSAQQQQIDLAKKMVEVNVTQVVPSWPTVGVQLNVRQTGLPVAGTCGVSVAPAGSGPDVIVTVSAEFESPPQT